MIKSTVDNSTKKRKSLAVTFRHSFVLIVVFSLISTIITYLLSMLLFNFALNSEKINPANYYENKIPVIEKYVESNGIDVLKRDSETELKNIVKGYDFFYQVVDINNEEKYTNFDKKVFNDKSEFQKSINKTTSKNNYYVNSIPIFNKEGKLEGAVLIMYKI
ncbi:MAG: sensor histidine kinase, partial [Peptacetobacter hiranonis]|nr:sensor histidine kinase [Peptacetobacter hiranonis]